MFKCFQYIFRVRINIDTSDVDQDGEISEQISSNTPTLDSDYSNCVPSTSSSSSSSSTPYHSTKKKVRRSNAALACTIRPIDKNHSELITQSIYNMIWEDMLPSNTVEHSGFKNVMNIIEPSYNVSIKKQ